MDKHNNFPNVTIFTQKYTVVTLLEDITEGYRFSASQWPLHVTLADTFTAMWTAQEIVRQLVELSSSQHKVTSTAMKHEYFGRDGQTKVTLLEKTDDLLALHHAVIQMLNNGGLKFDDPQFSEAGFRPHSTVQPHAEITIGQSVTLENLALIDMFPNKDAYQRKVLKITQLQD